MKYFNKILLTISFVIIALLYGCEHSKTLDERMYNNEISTTAIDTGENIAVAPPPFSEDIYPCSQCHADQETNHTKRVLVDMHEEISASFNHDKENRWCLDCHNADDRDYLHLASGKLISFDESYKLCGQCHGSKLRDWKAGVHGKRTGQWNGKKQYLLCVNCHNPHSPHFKKLKPLPPPIRQEDIKFDKNKKVK